MNTNAQQYKNIQRTNIQLLLSNVIKYRKTKLKYNYDTIYYVFRLKIIIL